MKGIVGRKLGMTQVFDQETGVLTPVTVIQAGPCPVVAIRTADADGYDAVQLAFDEVPAQGGVLTPASSMGMRLVERLRRAGMTFEVRELA